MTGPRFCQLEGEEPLAARQAQLDLLTQWEVDHPYQLPEVGKAWWWAWEEYKWDTNPTGPGKEARSA